MSRSSSMTKVKTPQELRAMRISGKLLATVLATLKQAIEPGMTTKDLSDIAQRELRSTGGKPTFLGYYGFPDVLCVSINDEVVHGIPSPKRVIEDGDLVSIDFGVTYDAMITDAARTVIAGKPRNKQEVELTQFTADALQAGIFAVHGHCKVEDISSAVQAILDKYHYGIVRDLVGHGVGHSLHEEPNIPNYGIKGHGPMLIEGMTIAIEPMATLGGYQVKIDEDGWTVRTRDGSRAAHFEDTVLVTRDGAEVLTQI